MAKSLLPPMQETFSESLSGPVVNSVGSEIALRNRLPLSGRAQIGLLPLWFWVHLVDRNWVCASKRLDPAHRWHNIAIA